jgi:hypothetical protein
MGKNRSTRASGVTVLSFASQIDKGMQFVPLANETLVRCDCREQAPTPRWSLRRAGLMSQDESDLPNRGRRLSGEPIT